MARKQVLLNCTEWDEETFEMLQQTYPHKKDVDILRELMFQWRLRHEGNETKDSKLIALVRMAEAADERMSAIERQVEAMARSLADVQVQLAHILEGQL